MLMIESLIPLDPSLPKQYLAVIVNKVIMYDLEIYCHLIMLLIHSIESPFGERCYLKAFVLKYKY